MAQTIIAMSGRKGAGKNTLASFITEWYTAQYKPNSVDSMECSFADTLKDFCIETLGVAPEQCYGTDDQKNTSTEYAWENVPDYYRWKFGSDPTAKDMVRRGCSPNNMMRTFCDLISPQGLKTGQITCREMMQLFGTDLIRQTFGNVWADATIRRIQNSGKSLGIITDNRFPNEIKAVLNQPQGFIIRLTRTPFGTEEVHPSESALDDFDWSTDRCYTLDNANLSMKQQNEAIVPILEKIFRESN